MKRPTNPDPDCDRRLRVLFLCTHNSARSQMAEGLLRALAGDRFEVASAGTEPTTVHSLAVRAMQEIGIDLSSHRSKTVARFAGQPFDYVIAVCDAADRACPAFPGAAARLTWSLEDPSQATGDEAARLAVFRRVRDELRRRIEAWLATDPAGAG
ncbi:MAG TPA: arsenate reductase ArsC [Thermodesulfobacteriota bacterium]|nr:arsenate reductase ArsC [Thermodesulfobacteriota bacterium]